MHRVFRERDARAVMHTGIDNAVSFEVGGGENVPGNPHACVIRNFTYLVRDPCKWADESSRIIKVSSEYSLVIISLLKKKHI